MASYDISMARGALPFARIDGSMVLPDRSPPAIPVSGQSVVGGEALIPYDS